MPKAGGKNKGAGGIAPGQPGYFTRDMQLVQRRKEYNAMSKSELVDYMSRYRGIDFAGNLKKLSKKELVDRTIQHDIDRGNI